MNWPVNWQRGINAFRNVPLAKKCQNVSASEAVLQGTVNEADWCQTCWSEFFHRASRLRSLHKMVAAVLWKRKYPAEIRGQRSKCLETTDRQP